MVSIIQKFYGILVHGVGYLRSPFLFLIRLYWGWQFFVTGKDKLMNLDKTAEFFQGLSIPMPKLNAFMAGGAECFGGLLLLLGLGSRVVSIPLAGTMVVAYLTAHPASVKTILTDPDTFVTQAPFLFLLASLIILIFGPGKLSLDYAISKFWLNRIPSISPDS